MKYLETLKNIRIENFKGSTGNIIPHQFKIIIKEGEIFRSYNSFIAFIPNDGSKIILGKAWNYSNTTVKYRNLFLRETKKQTESKLKSGEYLLNKNL